MAKEEGGFPANVRIQLLKESGQFCAVCGEFCLGENAQCAHIYDLNGTVRPSNLSRKEKQLATNGLVVCPNCHTIIDNPKWRDTFTAESLISLKKRIQDYAQRRIGDMQHKYLSPSQETKQRILQEIGEKYIEISIQPVVLNLVEAQQRVRDILAYGVSDEVTLADVTRCNNMYDCWFDCMSETDPHILIKCKQEYFQDRVFDRKQVMESVTHGVPTYIVLRPLGIWLYSPNVGRYVSCSCVDQNNVNRRLILMKNVTRVLEQNKVLESKASFECKLILNPANYMGWTHYDNYGVGMNRHRMVGYPSYGDIVKTIQFDVKDIHGSWEVSWGQNTQGQNTQEYCPVG